MNKEKMYIRGGDVDIPAHLNFGKFMLDRLRRMGDDKISIENIESGDKLTYKELQQYAVKLSIVLTQLGVRKGDIVALGSEKRLMLIPTTLAIILTGATYTVYDFTSGKAHLRYKMEITQPKFCITTSLFWETNREVLQSFKCVQAFLTLDEPTECLVCVKPLIDSYEDIDIDSYEPVTVQGQVDTALVTYSSGTTGMPKGVLITHLNCLIAIKPKDFKDDFIRVAYVTGDWFHTYDCFMTYKMLAHGIKTVFTNDISPETMIMAFEKAQVNLAFLVPSSVNLLLKTKRNPNGNLDCFKYMFCTGSPIYKETLESFKQRFPSIQDVWQGYGMTETWLLASGNWSTKRAKMGSVGSVPPCVTLKVEDRGTRQLLGPNQKGEICMKGPVFMKGYIGVEPSTYLDTDGFFRTGDLGYYDEDGFFYVVDRLKEFIDYDAYQVAPVEIETILLKHPGVREAGVVGKPVPIYGEEPTALVVRQPGSMVTEQELIDFVAGEVALYMQLKGGVKFISELPKNPRGKVLRSRLREILNEI